MPVSSKTEHHSDDLAEDKLLVLRLLRAHTRPGNDPEYTHDSDLRLEDVAELIVRSLRQAENNRVSS